MIDGINDSIFNLDIGSHHPRHAHRRERKRVTRQDIAAKERIDRSVAVYIAYAIESNKGRGHAFGGTHAVGGKDTPLTDKIDGAGGFGRRAATCQYKERAAKGNK